MVFRRVSLDRIDPCKNRVEVRCCDSASALTDPSLITRKGYVYTNVGRVALIF